MSVSPEGSEGVETYSCSRCRKLKKKCPRQLPHCANCAKAREVCHYPGRAPRRTKKELREAILKGEIPPSMKRKSSKMIRELTTADLRNLENWDDPARHGIAAGPLPHLSKNSAVSGVGILPHSGPQLGNPPQLTNAVVGTPMATTGDPGGQQNHSTTLGTDVYGNRTAYSLIPPAQKARIVLDQNPKFVNAQSAFKANDINIPVTSPHIANQVFPEGVSSLISALNTMNDNVSPSTPIALSYLQLQKLHHQQEQHLRHQQEQQLQQHAQQQLQQQKVLEQQLQHVRHDVASVPPPVNTTTHLTLPAQGTTPFSTAQHVTLGPILQQQQQLLQQNAFGNNAYGTKDTSSILPRRSSNTPINNERTKNSDNDDSVSIDGASIAYTTIKCKYNGSKTSNWVNEDGSFKPISRSLLDKFIAAYFKHNHRLFPMIDKIFLINEVSSIENFEQADKLAENNPNLSASFIFQLQMIMAIGCTTLQRAGMLSRIEEDLSEHLSFLAMRNFRQVLALQDLETVKCLLLLGIYSFFEPKGVSSWTISGITMRLVIELGLNRPLIAKKMTAMSATEVESRYRVFWSAYCYERVVATALGRISAIDDEDVGVPLPRPLYDSELEDIEVSNMIISLRKMGGKIYKEVHSVSAGRRDITMEEKQAIINKLRQELDNIYNAECEKRKLKKSKASSLAESPVSDHKEDDDRISQTGTTHSETVLSLISQKNEFSTTSLDDRLMTPTANSPSDDIVKTPRRESEIDSATHETQSDIGVAGMDKDVTTNATPSPDDSAALTNDAKYNEDEKAIGEKSPAIVSSERSESNGNGTTSGIAKTDDKGVTGELERSVCDNTASDGAGTDGKPATHEISFHTSDVWLMMRYSQLQIMLYRPSALIPKPPLESLTILGEFCLEAWKHTYVLYKKRLLPLNWITLFRTLTICNTILYCLCQWSIDLVACAIEIQQCVEILRHFGAKWVFAMKCADVFQNISNTIVDISLSQGQVPNIDKLTRELFGASDAYQDILDQNNVDVSWVDRLV